MLSTLVIRNYKSIVDMTLDLGRVNLFIGENGAGKTNILEAAAMASGALSNRLTNEDLIARGVRIAKSTMTMSAFEGHEQSGAVEISLRVRDGEEFNLKLRPTKNGSWSPGSSYDLINDISIDKDLLPDVLKEELMRFLVRAMASMSGGIADYGIYCASTLALRGLQVESHREPLGLYGEGLDVAIAQLPEALRLALVEHARVISWLDDLDIDREGCRKLEGYKPGRSRSDLYFADRFLSEESRLSSAENANEGILHLLFYLVLFMAPDTPKVFAIDNIETALNPHLLRHLVKALTRLAGEHDRQALVTTHNPAALDGLNLHDDDQRLFVVYRSDEGHTKVRRIKVKPESPAGGPALKLSELWMRGMLGGIPTHF